MERTLNNGLKNLKTNKIMNTFFIIAVALLIIATCCRVD